MWTKQRGLIVLVLVMFWGTLTGYSQKVVLNEKGDTSLCFSLTQAKFLLKEHYAKEMYKSLDSICKLQLQVTDSLIASNSRSIRFQEVVIKNQKEVISIRDHEIVDLKYQIASEQKKVRIQKVYKWLAIGVGGITSGYLGLKYITK